MSAALKRSALALQNRLVGFSEDLRSYEMPQGLHQLCVIVKAHKYHLPQHPGYLKQQLSLTTHLTVPRNLSQMSRQQKQPKVRNYVWNHP
jgi:hypothetical protein